MLSGGNPANIQISIEYINTRYSSHLHIYIQLVLKLRHLGNIVHHPRLSRSSTSSSNSHFQQDNASFHGACVISGWQNVTMSSGRLLSAPQSSDPKDSQRECAAADASRQHGYNSSLVLMFLVNDSLQNCTCGLCVYLPPSPRRYSVVGFIDKNKDTLFQDFKRLLYNRWHTHTHPRARCFNHVHTLSSVFLAALWLHDTPL